MYLGLFFAVFSHRGATATGRSEMMALAGSARVRVVSGHPRRPKVADGAQFAVEAGRVILQNKFGFISTIHPKSDNKFWIF